MDLQDGRLDQPDMIIMDLDPGEAVSWPEVIAAAVEVRERLAAVGCPASSRRRAAMGCMSWRP